MILTNDFLNIKINFILLKKFIKFFKRLYIIYLYNLYIQLLFLEPAPSQNHYYKFLKS